MKSEINKPIGVFDSGMGGLTVLKELTSLMPDESTIYFGDTARVPYGVRSPETVERYAFECADFLVQRGIKMLVVACNTVSALCLDALSKRYSIDVLGVVRPGARAAALATVTNRIAVVGTPATIKSRAYELAIQQINPSVKVLQVACPLFVPLAEEGWTDGDVARLTAMRYLKPVIEADCDTVVLGCTHYPLLRNTISSVLGIKTRIIDSATETAREALQRLTSSGLSSTAKTPERKYFVTDSAERFRELGGRFLGTPIEHLETVGLEKEADTIR